MGDRCNVVILPDSTDDAPVFLYSHWGGYTLPEVVASALERGRSRLDDAPYLTRIIFCEMLVGGQSQLGIRPTTLEAAIYDETGFGISTSLQDNNRPIIVINIATQRLLIVDEDAAEQQEWGKGGVQLQNKNNKTITAAAIRKAGYGTE